MMEDIKKRDNNPTNGFRVIRNLDKAD